MLHVGEQNEAASTACSVGVHPFACDALDAVLEDVTFAQLVRPHESAAAAWLDRGVDLVSNDRLGAAGHFSRAVSLGSDVGMAWLGLALFDAAIMGQCDPAEVDSLALAGLSWLETAVLAGVVHADTWLLTALNVCPAEFAKVWNRHPLYANVTVH